MAKQYRIYQIDAFTKEKLKGNPAGVVTNADGLSEQQMQEIAREFNNSETAFILSPEDDSYDVRVRFFTPTSEVPICGHAENLFPDHPYGRLKSGFWQVYFCVCLQFPAIKRCVLLHLASG